MPPVRTGASSRAPWRETAAACGGGAGGVGHWMAGNNNRKVHRMKTLMNGLLKGRITRWGFRTKKFVVLGLIAAGVLAGAFLAQAGDMVPYHSETIGQMQLLPDGSGPVAIEETGVGTHIGNFTLTGAIDEESGYFLFTVTAANGDKLFGAIIGGSGNTVELAILGGTGRFKGATGHITATITVDPNPVSLDPLILAYTATTTGEISTVGSNKNR